MFIKDLSQNLRESIEVEGAEVVWDSRKFLSFYMEYSIRIMLHVIIISIISGSIITNF